MDIVELQDLYASQDVEWTIHAAWRLLQRGISSKDIEEVLITGEVIEYYLNDYPFPSCLVLGTMLNKKTLHLVCAIGENKLWIITAYEPTLKEWEAGFKVRRRA